MERIERQGSPKENPIDLNDFNQNGQSCCSNSVVCPYFFPDKGNPRLNAFAQTGISIASELTQSIRNYFSKAAFRSIGIAW